MDRKKNKRMGHSVGRRRKTAASISKEKENDILSEEERHIGYM